MIKKIFLLSAIFCGTLSGFAQTKTEGDYIRSGNKFYADSLYEKAEIEYRKALEINPKSTDAMYNLGNALFNQIPQSQEKGKEAMEQYATAVKLESDKAKLAHINHNLGTLLYMAQQYPQSVEAYKESLRNNPNDNETRYNLAKAMYMLKQQQEQQQDQQQEQQQDQQQEQQQDQQQEQQQEQQEQQQEQQEQQQQEQNQQQQQQQQQENNDMSQENAEQLLESAMQDEKDVQEKVKKMMQIQGRKLEKDW